MNEQFEREAVRISSILPMGPRLVVIGSASFWDIESEGTCNAIGEKLGEVPGLTLITGGVEGAGDTVGRAFYRTIRTTAASERLLHVLPEGCQPRPYGQTYFAGATMEERREVLGRLAKLYLSVEGGPGTAHEAKVATVRGATVIPVGRSGGFSSELYGEMECPDWAPVELWRALATEVISPRKIADAVMALVSKQLAVTDRNFAE